MPNKKSQVHSQAASAKSSKKKAQEKSSNQLIYIVVAAILVIVVAVVAILYLTRNQPASTAAGATPTVQAATSAVKSTTSAQATPALVGTKQYASAPPMLIDVKKTYTATVKMAKGGEFVIQLLPDKAPITVNSFVFLARQGYFNGVTFHRVIDGFMAQGGDPSGTGSGGPGYKFKNEDSDLKFDKAGVVAMANAGRDTNGSQFFITFVPYPSLNGNYTIFGQVTSGMDVVNAITRRDPTKNPTTTGDVIASITIAEK